MKRYYFSLTLLSLLGLTACGDKGKPAAVAQKVQKEEDKIPTLPAIADKLGEYRVIDFSKEVDFKGFMAYRELFMKAAAADEKYDAKKFTEMALVEVGAETDAFKRDDMAKQGAAAVAEIKKGAFKKVLLADSDAKGNSAMGGSVSAYDMETESYTITFGIKGYAVGYGWQEKGRGYDYKFALDAPTLQSERVCFECSNTFDIIVKIPKEQAREIESKLSSLRGAGKSSVSIPVSFYTSVKNIDDSSNWEHARLHVNLDAIAMRLPNQSIDKTIILIDGPQLKRK